jgi:predicted RNase H-like HicB family nuclease
MKIKVIVHEAAEGGYWAEVPAIPGCATQGETFEELLKNLYEAVEGCLSVDLDEPKPDGRVFEIAIRNPFPARSLPNPLKSTAGNCYG